MRLTKHHGLGNDFLVLLDPDGSVELSADLARALCDRRRGLGSDGFIRVGRGTDGTDVSMELRNADGGPAEMSGNGIRCLGQAVARDRDVDRLDLLVGTAAGPRRLRVAPGPDERTALVEVDMGVAKVDVGAPPWFPTDQPAALVDVGNPHLVLEVDRLEDVAVTVEGPAIEALVPGGTNVEWFVRRAPRDLALVVWERGAGATQACGTGAVAVAAAAHALVGPSAGEGSTRVSMPGGSVEVRLGETATLVGPATFVADIEVPWP